MKIYKAKTGLVNHQQWEDTIAKTYPDADAAVAALLRRLRD